MNRIIILTELVQDFYESHRASWIPYWTEYLYKNHIFLVAELAEKLSEEFHINPEFSIAASLLHDIADAVVDRTDPDHMKISEMITLELLEIAWFSEEEREVIVYDIIAKHSCRNGIKPESIEGQIMTSADAIAHLSSDFYGFVLVQKMRKWDSIESIKTWWLPKVERDFFIKICFENIRERYRSYFEKSKNLFLEL